MSVSVFIVRPKTNIQYFQNVPRSDLLKEEITRWTQNYVDVNSLVRKLLEAERANRKLREEVALMKEKNRQIESDKDKLRFDYARLERELNDQSVLKYSLHDDSDCVSVNHTSSSPAESVSLVTILATDGFTNVTSPVHVTENNTTIINCNDAKIDSGLSSNSSTHSNKEEFITLEDEDLKSGIYGERNLLCEETLEKDEVINITSFNNNNDNRYTSCVDSNKLETLTRNTPSPPPRFFGSGIKVISDFFIKFCYLLIWKSHEIENNNQ